MKLENGALKIELHGKSIPGFLGLSALFKEALKFPAYES